MRVIIVALVFFVASVSYAEKFESLIKKVESHPQVHEVEQKLKKLQASAEAESSFKDPMLKFSALNVPKSSLRFDETPMSSRQIMVSQRFPLSTRLMHLSDRAEYLGAKTSKKTEYAIRTARSQLWILAAGTESLVKRIAIVSESLEWTKGVERSTQRLYSTGKINQISLLEIKLRRTELQSQLERLNFLLHGLKLKTANLVMSKSEVLIEKTPWKLLDTSETRSFNDRLEESLNLDLKAAKAKARAHELSYFPDITIGAAYSKRENVDGRGDFVSGYVQFSLPLWGETSSRVETARAESNMKSMSLDKYRLQKREYLARYKRQILSLSKEIEYISKSIEFAETERKLATKRYSLGRMSIFELLQIELRLREKKMKMEQLTEQYRTSLVEYRLLQGDPLNV